MLGISDPKAKLSERELQDEEEKIAKNPLHDRKNYNAILQKIKKRLKRNETESFFKSKACMAVSPFYDMVDPNIVRRKELSYPEMKQLLQSKLRLRLLCAYRFLKLLRNIRVKRKRNKVPNDMTLMETLQVVSKFYSPKRKKDIPSLTPLFFHTLRATSGWKFFYRVSK